MVVATIAWRHKAVPEANSLGIIAFDAGKTMCRLVSLYHSLSDEEIAKLNHEVIKSKGITYLNSQHECFLLNLAAAERLEELDTVGDNVSRLGQKCSDSSLGNFDLVYADLKLGLIDLRKLGYGSRSSLKIISKMEKLVSSTRSLYSAMESMMVLENSEKKRQRLKSNDYNKCTKQSLEYLNEEIECCRKQVQHYKEVSLWNQTLDKTVGIMAKVVCIVYARICSVFGGYIGSCRCYNINGDNEKNNCCCLLEHRELYKKNYCLYEESIHKRVSRSGPIPKADGTKTGVIRFLNHEFGRPMNSVNNRVLRLAPPSTVGGAGLAARYAEVVLLAEQWLHAPATLGKDSREAFYGMLPERVRRKVAAKLKGRWRREEEGEGEALAEGWRDAVEELLEWLSPVAHDTVRWQAERSMEARFEAKTTALLLQTLHYSDLEKAEAAIVEVLVGLSCIYWCEKTRNNNTQEIIGGSISHEP